MLLSMCYDGDSFAIAVYELPFWYHALIRHCSWSSCDRFGRDGGHFCSIPSISHACPPCRDWYLDCLWSKQFCCRFCQPNMFVSKREKEWKIERTRETIKGENFKVKFYINEGTRDVCYRFKHDFLKTQLTWQFGWQQSHSVSHSNFEQPVVSKFLVSKACIYVLLFRLEKYCGV